MKNKSLFVLFTLFLFVFALSLGAQAYVNSCPSSAELEHQRWLQKEYGVSSFEELRAKYEREAYKKVQTSFQQSNNLKENLLQMQSFAGLGTQTYEDIQKVLDNMEASKSFTDMPISSGFEQPRNFNPFVGLSITSLTSMGFIIPLFVPKVGKKLKGKKLYLYVAVATFVVGLILGTFVVGPVYAQSSEIAIEKGSLQTEASYIIFQDGTTIKARDQWGNIPFSGTDASTVINSALGALTSGRTWKEKVVLKGDFTISSKILISDYTISDLRQAKLTLANGVNDDMFTNKDYPSLNWFIEIWGGILEGNYANQATTSNGLTLKVGKSKFVGVYVYNFRDRGWALDSCIENEFIQCWAVECGRTSDTDGFLLNINFDDNIFVECVASYNKQAGFTVASGNRNIFVGCRADYNGDPAVGGRLDGFLDAGSYNSYIGCMSLNNNADGFAFDTAKGNNIIGGASLFNGAQGILISDGSSHVRVLGAVVANNGQDGVRIDNSCDNIVEAITAYDDQATKTQDWGIAETATSNYNLIQNNIIYALDHTTGAISKVGGETIVKYNLGYLTEKSGTATIANNEWVTHGLATTPTKVLVTTRTATYGGIAVIVGWVGQNSTHFQVSAMWSNSTAITADAINIVFYAEV